MPAAARKPAPKKTGPKPTKASMAAKALKAVSGAPQPPVGRIGGEIAGKTRFIRDHARAYAPEMIKILVKLAKTSESDQARIAAAKEVLDRGLGKAVAVIDADIRAQPVAVYKVTPDQAEEKRLEQARQAAAAVANDLPKDDEDYET